MENDLAKIALSCHFALDLLCYRKRCLPPAHGVPYVSVAPLPASRRRVWRVATTLCFTFQNLLLLVHFSLVYVRIHCSKNGHHLSQWHHSVFLPGHDLRSYLIPEKAASVKCFDAFIVVRHGGNVHRDVYRNLFLR